MEITFFQQKSSLAALPGSVYIHYPLCKHTCSYCDFNVYTAANVRSEIHDFDERWVRGLERDLQNSFADLSLRPSLDTLYIGGGTPSLLEPKSLQEILSFLGRYYDLNSLTELSLEANPESIDRKQLVELKNQGVNRLSLGIQSLQPLQLRRLERLSTHKQILQSLTDAAEVFKNFSVDFMLGIPEQTRESILTDLESLMQFSPPHISTYILTLKDDHVFRKHPLLRGAVENDDLVMKIYLDVIQFLKSKGYRHYEVSNFAKPGFESHHNRTYWDPSKSYLGLGPGAHGYSSEAAIRYERLRDPKKWMDSKSFEFVETLNSEQRELESTYLKLRTRRPILVANEKKPITNKLKESQLIDETSEGLILTDSGWLLMETVAHHFV